MKFIFSTLVALVFLSGNAYAQQTSLIEMNTRVFDMRVDVDELRRDDDFIPLNDIKWLRDVIERDPLLPRTVVHIQVRPDPVLTFWPTREPDKKYYLTGNIPKKFVVD